MGKAEGKRQRKKPRLRWKDNIKKEFVRNWFGWEVVETINLAQTSEKWWGLVNRVIKIGVP